MPEPSRAGGDYPTVAKRTVWEASVDDMPAAIDGDDGLRLTTRRLLELAAEQCDAIGLLRDASLHRPAHAVLRGLLESLSYLAWIAVEPVRHHELYVRGATPGMREVIKRLGWEPEYERTYDFLSDLAHPREQQLHMYRHMDAGTADGLLPEIVPDMEMYVLPAVAGVPYVSFSPMTAEEAETIYGVYLAAKTLDLTLAAMLAFFRPEDARQRSWWPTSAAWDLAILARDHDQVRKALLCRPSDLAWSLGHECG